MQLHGDIIIGRTSYAKGSEIPWYKVYPFFMLHMLVFGASGFAMAYASRHPPIVFLYLHGGFAISIYTAFYVTIFGRDEVKWMFINAALGVFGISSQIDWLLSYFGKGFDDYPWYIHVIPFLYYALYTFLLRHAVLDLTGSRQGEPEKRKRVEYAYIGFSIALYVILHYWELHR